MYTMDKGALPVRLVHLYCYGMSSVSALHSTNTHPTPLPLECQTNYHHNFKVKDGVRTYYNEIPSIIQVGEHQFAEKRLIQLWITMMLVSW